MTKPTSLDKTENHTHFPTIAAELKHFEHTQMDAQVDSTSFETCPDEFCGSWISSASFAYTCIFCGIFPSLLHSSFS
jgi:hypothetical protein